MLVRLTQKHADAIDGVDLSAHSAGQLLDLPERDAALLIAEGWAAPASAEFTRAREEAASQVSATATPHGPAAPDSLRRGAAE
jgi:hypothetical protein